MTRIDFLDFNNTFSKFLKVTYPDTITEVYTFQKTGTTTPIVLQLTVVYTDSTKENIDTVTVNTPNQVA